MVDGNAIGPAGWRRLDHRCDDYASQRRCRFAAVFDFECFAEDADRAGLRIAAGTSMTLDGDSTSHATSLHASG
jgi:hypothetical protein